MSLLTKVCSKCRTINLPERILCGICGEKLGLAVDLIEKEVKTTTNEEQIVFNKRPIELTLFLILNYIGLAVLFIMLESKPLHSITTWTLLPLSFIAVYIILYYIQIGNNEMRVLFIALGIAVILELLIQRNYIFILPVLIDIGILVLDQNVIHYCKT